MIEKGIVKKILANNALYKNVVLKVVEAKQSKDHAKLAVKLKLTDDEETVQAVVMKTAFSIWRQK